MARGGGHSSADRMPGLAAQARRQLLGERPPRILSIDGGGIRAIIPALILAEIEQQTGQPTSELFDLVAGTSTGAILALALTVPDPDTGRPRYSAQDLVDLWAQEGEEMFKRSLLRKLLTADGYLGPKYGEKHVNRFLHQALGETRLREALTDVVVPSYDLERRQPRLFRTLLAREDTAHDFRMRDVARAATAIPTYFRPARLRNRINGRRHVLIDGSVVAANPALLAFAEACELGLAEDATVLSLGTGAQAKPMRWRKTRRWGAIRWLRPALDTFLDGSSKTADYELLRLLGQNNYIRLQTHLAEATPHLDDVSAKNIEALRREAQETMVANAPCLESFYALVITEDRREGRV